MEEQVVRRVRATNILDLKMLRKEKIEAMFLLFVLWHVLLILVSLYIAYCFHSLVLQSILDSPSFAMQCP